MCKTRRLNGLLVKVGPDFAIAWRFSSRVHHPRVCPRLSPVYLFDFESIEKNHTTVHILSVSLARREKDS